MPITLDGALGIHEQAVKLRAQRAELLATNLANADTPNYRARDIDFKAALTSAQAAGQGSPPLAATHAGHLQHGAGGINPSLLLYRNPHQASLDGNTVDTQVEQAEFAQNALHYMASLTFLSGKISGLMSAIKGE
ncbi:MAG: flagellar basal body rod protein FlgB [Gammaproteobacteria bacterium]|nr:flagellar basal body rod protein FlgB [Gammaproteobacteria bacterium]